MQSDVFIAEKDDDLPGLILFPDGRRVYPHLIALPEQSDAASAQPAPFGLFVGMHPACEDLVNRVMETSSNSRIHSLGDLWMTLERRCARRELRDGGTRQTPSFNYPPNIPTSQAGEEVQFSIDRYFWNHNPINIPDLTTQLLSNLEPISRVTTPIPLSTSTQEFKSCLAALPAEIQNELVPWFQMGSISVDCNYMMPQSLWKQIFFQIPFLWDLDTEQVLNRTCSEPSETEEWNWEKITRQVLSPAQPSDRGYEGDEKGYLWSHETVGLHVPPGFTNRRRIWQILEEMWPNDVGLDSDYWPTKWPTKPHYEPDALSRDEWEELDLWPDLD
ncbi:hypothetical protein CEP52_007187 [Fusarium oligoseptatum]|uniref:Uncharacterized protein n=1 Tax=Fusarium oligoseptatum TaxID=2604345 RepID=A0A428TNZ3_9HYPO|nr:hypothetical protein CEP52_007187 [Fusarium oligoseptatum]